MFVELGERGYSYADANVLMTPTQRMRPDGTPRPPYGKIDWLFARGLVCRDPTNLPAVDAQGDAISDHDVLLVTIELP
jgi:hypothetical protein